MDYYKMEIPPKVDYKPSEEFFECLDRCSTHKAARLLGITNNKTTIVPEGRADSDLTTKVIKFFQDNWTFVRKFNPAAVGSPNSSPRQFFEHPDYRVEIPVREEGYRKDCNFVYQPEAIIVAPIIIGSKKQARINQRNVGLAVKDICAYLRAENIPHEVFSQYLGQKLTSWGPKE